MICTMPDSISIESRKMLRFLGARLELTPREKGINGDFRSAFFDDWGSPWSVCRPPRLSTRGVMTATTAMILMRPGEGHLEACPMPALNRRFTAYTLTPDRVAQRAVAE